ncbi:MAG: hypothetical protein Q9167_007187 [Letrouitia subvulpina]
MASVRSLPLTLRAGRRNMNPPSNPFEEQSAESSENEVSPEESASIVNGIEHVPPRNPLRRAQDGSPGKLSLTKSQRNHGILQAKNEVLDVMINKLLPPEETDFMVRNLERQTDEPIRRTYRRGVPLAEVQEPAIRLRVGLTFLPGADKP